MPDNIDPIEEQIRKNGFVDNHRLWRRWVLSQVFRSYVNANGIKSFEARFLHGKPYNYEWDTAEADIKTLRNMSEKDLKKRSRFFNFRVIINMLRHYRSNFETSIKHMAIHTDCFGRYVCIRGFDRLYLDDTAKNWKCWTVSDVIHHVELAQSMAEKALTEQSYEKLYRAIRHFRYNCPVSIVMQKSPVWWNAFLGSGAYYTMDNLIKFHGCVFTKLGRPLSMEESLDHLETMTNQIAGSGNSNGHLVALMDELIDQNKDHISTEFQSLCD